MYMLINHTILVPWQRVALITLAAVGRVLREAYFFRLNCCKDLCREALHFFLTALRSWGMCSCLIV